MTDFNANLYESVDLINSALKSLTKAIIEATEKQKIVLNPLAKKLNEVAGDIISQVVKK